MQTGKLLFNERQVRILICLEKTITQNERRFKMISKLMKRKGRLVWAVQVFSLFLMVTLLMLLGDARTSWSHDNNHNHYGQNWAGSSAGDGLSVTQNKSGSSNSALFGNNNSGGYGVHGRSNLGYGVYGTSSSGKNRAGVYGRGFNSSTSGVYGYNDRSSGKGVYGYARRLL